MSKVIRAVVECGVPDHVTEKALVLALKRILQYPIQLGHAGDVSTLAKPDFKQYSRVRAAERLKEAEAREQAIEQLARPRT